MLATFCVSGAQSANNAPAVNKPEAFPKFISDRNIFNPARYARNPTAVRVPRTTSIRRKSFGLTGIIKYDLGETPGIHAFFDGTSAEYRKACETGGTVAVFKIVDLTMDAVTLAQDSTSNTFVLKIGQQMADDGRGRWSLSAQTVSYASSSSGDSFRNSRRGNFNVRGENNGETTPETTDTNLPEDDLMMPDDGTGDPGDPTSDAVEAPAETSPAEILNLPSGPASDVLRRLMEQRARDEQ